MSQRGLNSSHTLVETVGGGSVEALEVLLVVAADGIVHVEQGLGADDAFGEVGDEVVAELLDGL